jgi:hypothetical protein
MSAGARPIELVRAPEPADAGASWPVTNWWIMGPLIAVGIAGFAVIQARRTRAARLTDSERAFRALARGQPTRFRVLARELAESHGGVTPAAVMISNGALAEAARSIEAKPGSARRRVLDEMLGARGVEPLGRDEARATDA